MRAALVLAALALAVCGGVSAQDTVAAVMQKDNQLSDFYEYAQQASQTGRWPGADGGAAQLKPRAHCVQSPAAACCLPRTKAPLHACPSFNHSQLQFPEIKYQLDTMGASAGTVFAPSNSVRIFFALHQQAA